VKQQQEDGHLMSLSPIQHIQQSPVPPTLGQQSPVPAVLKESLGDAVVGAVRRKVVEKLSQSKNGLRRQQNESECDINLAYSILVHGSVDGTQLERLLRLLQAIYTPQHYYAVHVSTNSKPGFFEAVQAAITALHLPRLQLILRRQHIAYSGVSRALADLISMRELLTMGDWDFWMGLTVNEYPLQTDAQLRRFLGAHRGRNFLELEPLAPDTKSWQAWKRRRIHQAFVDMGGSVQFVGDGKMTPEKMYGVQHYIGAAMGGLSREFCEYLRDSSAVLELFTYYATSQFPDEHFVHTALMNSPLAHTQEPNHLRFWMWDWAECKVSRHHVAQHLGVNYISSGFHPCFLVASDFPPERVNQIEAENRFFGYKFEQDIDDSGFKFFDARNSQGRKPAALQCGETASTVKHGASLQWNSVDSAFSSKVRSIITAFEYSKYAQIG